MAKLSVTVIAAVILFLFSSTLSNARITSDIPENDVTNREIQNPRLESDHVHPRIRFPSEKSIYASHAHDSGNEGSKHTATATATVTAVPLRAVKFRPINRHFHLRSSVPFRLCHHHHHHHHRHQHHFRPMRQRDGIPYEDDMILSIGENNDLDPMFFPGSLREAQPSWVRIHHHHHHHHGEDDDSDAENELSRSGVEKYDGFGKKKDFRKHFHRDEDEDEEGREKAVKDDEKMKREKEGGFLKHFRKFLNQFEF